MRKIIIISLVLIVIIASNCGNGRCMNSGNSASQANSIGTSDIVFREYQHDFGKVAEGEKISYTFTFDNKGTGNLVIASATTTCGCTVSKYDTRPIPPRGKGNLEVIFDTSGRNGMQTKTITVKSNASTPVVLLKITAEVAETTNN
ncbi:MAG: DUF1573 domain-containing protein [Bacteroidales bacterium]|jgi:hypothetical protein